MSKRDIQRKPRVLIDKAFLPNSSIEWLKNYTNVAENKKLTEDRKTMGPKAIVFM